MKTSCILFALVAATSTACAEAPSMQLQAPGKIRAALDLFEDLGADAQLVKKGEEPGAATALSRGADGVSFTGFVEAAPGEYTLEIAFSGVRTGTTERHFLGRLVSDAFTVAEGQDATPPFNNDVDTIGRPDDHGDDDEDGLGFLDEVLFGTDPDAADSDSDGVDDGADCDPADTTRAIVIAEGGSVRDCDGDGFDRFDVPSGDPGQDCDDADAAVSPAAEDACTDALDADCNPATCPSDDAEGPTIDGIATTTGGVIGCQEGLRAHVFDASSVTSVTVKFVDDPYPTADRVATMTLGDDDVWELPSLAAYGSSGFRAGAHQIEIRAYDQRGNVSTATSTFDLQPVLPSVSMTAVLTIDDAPVQLTITPSSTRPIASVKLYTAPVAAGASGGLQSAWTMVKDVGAAGGTVTIAPSDIPGTGEAALFPVIVDDVGNRLQPSVGALPGSGAVAADFTCDGSYTHTVPVVMRPSQGGAGTVFKMEDLLQDAISRATAAVPGAQLVKVIGFGVRQDGTVDLSSTTNYMRRWAFYFKEPGAMRWISYMWLTAAYGATTPTVDLDDTSLSSVDVLSAPSSMVGSGEATAAFVAAGAMCMALTGADGDTVMYIDNGDGDVVYVFNATDTWIADAVSLVATLTDCE